MSNKETKLKIDENELKRLPFKSYMKEATNVYFLFYLLKSITKEKWIQHMELNMNRIL